jgi:hypothetical protein
MITVYSILVRHVSNRAQTWTNQVNVNAILSKTSHVNHGMESGTVLENER